jgi:hypothetical protein
LSVTPLDLVAAAATGFGATLTMDLWNLFLLRAFGIPSLNYCLLGRWALHIPAGTVRHPSIAAAAPRRRECAVGWLVHYSIGAGLAVAFVALVSGSWLAAPTLLPALTFGIVTVVFPFFVLQPSLGLGIASSRVAHPAAARVKSLATHVVFGVGLFACASLFNAVRRLVG